MTFPLTHPDTKAVYEARTERQAAAMAQLGWEPATKAQVEKAQAEAVQADLDAYEELLKPPAPPVYADSKTAPTARPTTPPPSGSTSADPTTTEA